MSLAGAFSRMSALLDRGDLRLVEIQAVPRSLSTALGRCLNEAGGASVFVNEPFNTPAADIDSAAEHVLAWAEPALADAAGPVTVVSKNMARNLSSAPWGPWASACDAVVWCVRDPRVQISSLVTRTANDLLFGLGADRIEQRDLQPHHLEMVDRFLQNSPASTDFSKTGWHAIGARFASYPDDRRRVVADVSRFGQDPDRLLRYLCDGAGLRFERRMVRGWSRRFLNVNRAENPGVADSADAWISHAATSQGIQVPGREPLDIAVLPPAMRRHLLDVALPVYDTFMHAFHADWRTHIG